MSDWIINVNDGQEVITRDDGLYDVTVADSLNPFGSYAKAFIDDLDGGFFDLLSRGAKVEFQYSADYTSGFETRFVGFTVNELLNDADGAEQLEAEAYSFDQFLRGDEVSNDQTGHTIFEALEDVLTTDVPPVEWEPANVEVVDNVELTQSFQGETVEEFLFALRQKSGGELPGVNVDLEFTWGPAERTRTRRDIDNSEWINHDIGEESGETKNQVKVSFADGDRSIIVDDTGDQLTLQDNLGATGPGQEGASITRPEITNFEDAIDAGEQFLADREASLTGPVTTFELNDAVPGQVIGVEIEPRGIDGDFRIAENLIRWGDETNELTVVAKKGADDDILIEQSRTLKRVENRPRDDDVIPDRVTDTKPTAELPISVDASGTSADVSRVVNDGRNRIRDGLINENPIQSFEVVFSTSDSRPSRSDSDIANIVDTAIPTITTDAQSVTYAADTVESSIRTVGVRDTNQNVLLAVARLEDSVSNPSVEFTIGVENDDELRNIWTNTGLNLVRDILAGDDPDWPSDYAYGSDGSDRFVTQTTLGNEVIRQSLNEVFIGGADNDSEWNEQIEIADTDPLRIDDGVETTPTAEWQDARFAFQDFSDGPPIVEISDSEYVDGEAALFSSDGQLSGYNITFNQHTVPSDSVGVAIRTEVIEESEFEIRLNGEVIDRGEPGSLSMRWVDVSNFSTPFSSTEGYDGPDIEPGEEWTVELETLESNAQQEWVVDQIVCFDRRFYPEVSDWDAEGWDNTDGNGQLPGPPTFPSQVEIEAPTINTRRDITEATVDSDWTATENDQFIEVRIGDDAFTRANNTETLTVTGGPNTSLDVRFGLSNDGVRLNPTPTQGFEPQRIISYEGIGNPDAITKDDLATARVQAIIRQDDAVGETFAESGLIDSADNLLTTSRIPEFVKDEQLVISSERLRFNNP